MIERAPTRATPWRWLVGLGLIVLCNAVGFLSSLPGREQPTYEALVQPSWAPPSWLFAPVWTSLYTLMGIATYLVWRSPPGPRRRLALGVFAIQLALNASWSPVFFALHQYAAALVVIVAILAAVVAMIATYARVSRVAAALTVPLALWVSFATALNAAIVALN
ncbi:MAG: tryptophan-rich sensory protein [Myxococcota bacterium]|nr:tryptophan-rich sensory protein [Myxococcota bacterium]